MKSIASKVKYICRMLREPATGMLYDKKYVKERFYKNVMRQAMTYGS